MTIAGAQLKQIVPNLSLDRSTRIADLINLCAPHYGMYNYDVLHEFIANVAHESGGFRYKEEGLSYSAEAILRTWPSRFKTIDEAKPYARNPQKLANKVYGGRMGNTGANDGWLYRGAGFIQLTGKDMFLSYQKYVHFDTLHELADALRTDDYWAMDSAMWLFSVEKKLIQLAKDDKFETIVRRINGGIIGLTDRQAYYERAKKVLK